MIIVEQSLNVALAGRSRSAPVSCSAWWRQASCAIGAYVRSTGRIELVGRPVDQLPAHRRAALSLGRTFQDAALFADLMVREPCRSQSRLGRVHTWCHPLSPSRPLGAPNRGS